MAGVPIHDEEHRTAAVAHKALEEIDECLRVQLARVHLEPERAQIVDGRDRVDLLALPARAHLGSLPLGSPRSSESGIGAHTGFVEEEDLRTCTLRTNLQERVGRFLPVLDRRGIALVRAPQRLLWRDLELG